MVLTNKKIEEINQEILICDGEIKDLQEVIWNSKQEIKGYKEQKEKLLNLLKNDKDKKSRGKTKRYNLNYEKIKEKENA